MEQPTWWYLLAGVILGFTLSTLWEWLYFRRKRLILTDRRIAELEAGLRAATRAQQELTLESAEAWPAASYRSPDVFLETEAPQAAGAWPAAVQQYAPQPALEPVAAPVRPGNGATPVSMAPDPAAERGSAATIPANGHNGPHPKPSAGVSVPASGESPSLALVSTGATPPQTTEKATASAVAERPASPVSATEIKQLAASIHALLAQMGGVPTK